jgi:hypothetical protein
MEEKKQEREEECIHYSVVIAHKGRSETSRQTRIYLTHTHMHTSGRVKRGRGKWGRRRGDIVFTRYNSSPRRRKGNLEELSQRSATAVQEEHQGDAGGGEEIFPGKGGVLHHNVVIARGGGGGEDLI